MEGKVLNALNFKLTASTAKNFLRRFQRAAHVKSTEKNLCNYLCEITLQVSQTDGLLVCCCLVAVPPTDVCHLVCPVQQRASFHDCCVCSAVTSAMPC
jgi:hypothetical protein